jgi:hypothetical protein
MRVYGLLLRAVDDMQELLEKLRSAKEIKIEELEKIEIFQGRIGEFANEALLVSSEELGKRLERTPIYSLPPRGGIEGFSVEDIAQTHEDIKKS